jgi:hypothetical protein
MALKMDDGTEREFAPGDAFHTHPYTTPGSSARRRACCWTFGA